MKIGFIGAGQMARALAKGFVASGLVSASDIMAADCMPAAVDAFLQEVEGASGGSSTELVSNSDIVFLAVKPQHVASVAKDVSLPKGTLLVSIAAGVTIAQLEGMFRNRRIIRVMPNTPCLVGKGASGFSVGADATSEDAQTVGQLLAAIGVAAQLSEPLLDGVTGLSGSGPAFVYQFIEALSDGAVRTGIPREVATRLAAQTVMGAAAMVLETGEHPGVLKDRVTSPGGTTIAGLHALEKNGFRAAAMDAVVAATERSKELGGK